MAKFEYEIRVAGGQISSGVIEADSLLDASSRLQNRGGYVLNLEPVRASAASVLERLKKLNVESGPGLKDVRNFTDQLAVMIKAGINIRSALEAVADQVENQKFRRMIEQVKSDVEAGQPLSDALAQHPKVFSPLYVNMVKASEMSGNFGNMLERIASYLNQQVETRSMVRGAMIYPAIIATMAVVTTVFMLTYVLPKFIKLFDGKEHLLPKPTKALMAISGFCISYWYVLIAGVGAMVAGYCYSKTIPAGRLFWDKCKLKVPLFSRMFRALYITRGLHTMGELINAGVPMLETLEITADISGNALFEDMWRAVHNEVRQGGKISQPLAEQGMMPKNVTYMVAAGEQSGKLAVVLRDVASYYSKELRNTIKAVTAMIEPAMIVIMGALVGFIAMSIILPVFKMSSLVK